MLSEAIGENNVKLIETLLTNFDWKNELSQDDEYVIVIWKLIYTLGYYVTPKNRDQTGDCIISLGLSLPIEEKANLFDYIIQLSKSTKINHRQLACRLVRKVCITINQMFPRMIEDEEEDDDANTVEANMFTLLPLRDLLFERMKDSSSKVRKEAIDSFENFVIEGYTGLLNDSFWVLLCNLMIDVSAHVRRGALMLYEQLVAIETIPPIKVCFFAGERCTDVSVIVKTVALRSLFLLYGKTFENREFQWVGEYLLKNTFEIFLEMEKSTNKICLSIFDELLTFDSHLATHFNADFIMIAATSFTKIEDTSLNWYECIKDFEEWFFTTMNCKSRSGSSLYKVFAKIRPQHLDCGLLLKKISELLTAFKEEEEKEETLVLLYDLLFVLPLDEEDFKPSDFDDVGFELHDLFLSVQNMFLKPNRQIDKESLGENDAFINVLRLLPKILYLQEKIDFENFQKFNKTITDRFCVVKDVKAPVLIGDMIYCCTMASLRNKKLKHDSIIVKRTATEAFFNKNEMAIISLGLLMKFDDVCATYFLPFLDKLKDSRSLNITIVLNEIGQTHSNFIQNAIPQFLEFLVANFNELDKNKQISNIVSFLSQLILTKYLKIKNTDLTILTVFLLYVAYPNLFVSSLCERILMNNQNFLQTLVNNFHKVLFYISMFDAPNLDNNLDNVHLNDGQKTKILQFFTKCLNFEKILLLFVNLLKNVIKPFLNEEFVDHSNLVMEVVDYYSKIRAIRELLKLCFMTISFLNFKEHMSVDLNTNEENGLNEDLDDDETQNQMEEISIAKKVLAKQAEFIFDTYESFALILEAKPQFFNDIQNHFVKSLNNLVNMFDNADILKKYPHLLVLQQHVLRDQSLNDLPAHSEIPVTHMLSTPDAKGKSKSKMSPVLNTPRSSELISKWGSSPRLLKSTTPKFR
eukprot:TRINITY_DN2475_c0_g7_i1.p1 TRINITY_DN2475_c0_g7~~TRINITY_DN2475_c0_g7_i1.p1  ORF type:complete len:929 (+),score=226.16 TRINITY_DN2475_c0_g7_i1:29-2788(+)